MKWAPTLSQAGASDRDAAAGWLLDIARHPLLASPTASDIISPQGTLLAPPTARHIISPQGTLRAPPTPRDIISPQASPTASDIISPQGTLRAPPTSSHIISPQGTLQAPLAASDIISPQGSLQTPLTANDIISPQTMVREPLTTSDVISLQRNSGEIVAADCNSDIESSNQPCCRICLEFEDNKRGNALISPCMCKGTQQFVHRSCLDQWRSVKEGLAFSHCMTCGAQYHLRVDLSNTNFWCKTKFYLYVAKDILLVFLVIQLIITSIGTIAYLLDRNGSFRNFFNHGWLYTLSEHLVPFYYCLGALSSLVLFGIVGVTMDCLSLLDDMQTTGDQIVVDHYQSSQNDFMVDRYQSSQNDFVVDHYQSSQNDYVPILVDAPDLHSSTYRREQDVVSNQYNCIFVDGSCNCCCDCLCEGVTSGTTSCCSYICNNNDGNSGTSSCCSSIDCCASGGDDHAHCLIIIATILVLVFAILGILYGIFAATIMFKRIWQSHYHILEKRELTKEYVVEDLHGNYAPPQLEAEHENRLKCLKLL